MSGADCTPAPDVTHRHIRGDLGLHCVGGRAGTGGEAVIQLYYSDGYFC